MSHALLDLPLDEIAKKHKGEKKASARGGRGASRGGARPSERASDFEHGGRGRGRGRGGRGRGGSTHRPNPYKRVRFITQQILLDVNRLISTVFSFLGESAVTGDREQFSGNFSLRIPRLGFFHDGALALQLHLGFDQRI